MSRQPLELIFSDVWGPAPDSIGRNKYYVSFIDDYSKFTWIYLLKFKSDVFQKFHEFQNLVERLFNRKIIAIQSDWEGEYEKLNSFFTKIGISHQVSCPHTHQQNGSAKRKHRHIVEVGLSLLARASMPLKFWDETFLAATFLINRTPSKVINFQTPIERLFSVKPHYSSLRIFGCACWPNLRPYNQHKLEFRSKECVFLGYSNMHKDFKCLDTRTGHIYISRDIVFDEDLFPFSKLHDNVGARLTSEILLLPPTLLPSNSEVVNNGVPVTDFHTSDQPSIVSGDNSNMQHAEINADHTLMLQDVAPTSTPASEGGDHMQLAAEPDESVSATTTTPDVAIHEQIHPATEADAAAAPATIQGPTTDPATETQRPGTRLSKGIC
jgi:hypothetical protein